MRIFNLDKSTIFCEGNDTILINLTRRPLCWNCDGKAVSLTPMEISYKKNIMSAAEALAKMGSWGRRQVYMAKICTKAERKYGKFHQIRIFINNDHNNVGTHKASWTSSVVIEVRELV